MRVAGKTGTANFLKIGGVVYAWSC